MRNRMQNKKQKQKKYKFEIVVKQDIDYDLLAEDLTKKNPIILITIGTKRIVGVHKSILIKSDICKLNSPLLNYKSLCSFYNSKGFFQTSHEFSKWIEWAKKVKQAKWPILLHQKETVKVILPTI